MIETCVRAIPHDVQGAEGKVVAVPHHSVCAKRKLPKHCFLEGRSLNHVFSLFEGVLESWNIIPAKSDGWQQCSPAGDACHDTHVPPKLRNCWVERWELASSS